MFLKNPIVALRHEWKEAIFNGHVIQCPNHEQCHFQTSSATDMEYHYLKCAEVVIIHCYSITTCVSCVECYSVYLCLWQVLH